MRFLDRRDAGLQLAAELMPFAVEHPVIVALPRGGLPVASEVARALHAPLEILAVRKIGAPGNPELAVGAVAEDGTGVLDPRSADMLGMTDSLLEATLERESHELRRRVARYREGHAPLALHGRTAIIVDDGMATGMTDLAAVRAVRKQGATRVIVAVPVGSGEAIAMLEADADTVICLTVPRRLYGVGMWYEDFTPVGDEEVLALLDAARCTGAAAGASAAQEADSPPAPPLSAREASPTEKELAFELGQLSLPANLILPPGARALVVFAHGSGSSRASPRNRAVARALATAGLASLRFDLLSAHEAERRELAFDVPLLGGRLEEVTRQAGALEGLGGLALGYFGASTGAAAALSAAARLGGAVGAVVSRGGRPDLAGEDLERVTAPTLLIVGARDRQVLELNRSAAERLRCEHELAIVEGAGHLFEEPGAMERVATFAIDWFQRHLG
jgi:putative phosphoribosyl transferase